MRETYVVSSTPMSSTSRAVRRYSYGFPSTREIPVGPSTNASASIQVAAAPADDASSARHGRVSAQRSAKRHARTAMSTAAAVAAPTCGTHRP